LATARDKEEIRMRFLLVFRAKLDSKLTALLQLPVGNQRRDRLMPPIYLDLIK
jgi:hypothetical protein